MSLFKNNRNSAQSESSEVARLRDEHRGDIAEIVARQDSQEESAEDTRVYALAGLILAALALTMVIWALIVAYSDLDDKTVEYRIISPQYKHYPQPYYQPPYYYPEARGDYPGGYPEARGGGAEPAIPEIAPEELPDDLKEEFRGRPEVAPDYKE